MASPLITSNPFDTPEAGEDYRRWWESPLGETVFRIELANLLRLLPPAPAKGLDLGCGTGNFALAIASEGHEVVGLDGSRAMLEVARRSATGARIGWTHAEMEELPFETGAFDFVYQIASLEFARDRRAALREVARVLRPGGRYLLGLVSHRSLYGLLKPGRRRKIPLVDLEALREELQAFRLNRVRQDIFLPPWNVPSIRLWGPAFERLGALVGHGGAHHLHLFERV